MTLSTFFQLAFQASIDDDTHAFGPNPLPVLFPFQQATLTDGDDTNEANQVGIATIEITSSIGSVTISLMDGLLDPRGNPVSFTRIAAIAVYNPHDPEDEPWANLIVGDAASAPWETWTLQPGATVDIGPGGVWSLFSPVGYTVNSTHDNLMFTNPNTNGTMTAHLMVVGSN